MMDHDLALQTLVIKPNISCVLGTSGKDPVIPTSSYQLAGCKGKLVRICWDPHPTAPLGFPWFRRALCTPLWSALL